MLNTISIYYELQENLSEPASKKLAELFGKTYEDLYNSPFG